MRRLGARQKTRELNAASASFNNENNGSKKLEDFFLIALIMPPLDELASAVLILTYVWQYTGGFAVRAMRREARDHRERTFVEGIKETRQHYIEENRRLRALHKEERTTRIARDPESKSPLEDTARVGDVAKRLLAEAVIEQKRDNFDLEHPEAAKVGSTVELLDGAVRDLRETGLNQLAQDRLFANKRLGDLPEHHAKAVLILLEDNFQPSEVQVKGSEITLTPKAVAAAAAIRRIVDHQTRAQLGDSDPVDMLLVNGEKFAEETADQFEEALRALQDVDLEGLDAELDHASSTNFAADRAGVGHMPSSGLNR